MSSKNIALWKCRFLGSNFKISLEKVSKKCLLKNCKLSKNNPKSQCAITMSEIIFHEKHVFHYFFIKSLKNSHSPPLIFTTLVLIWIQIVSSYAVN